MAVLWPAELPKRVLVDGFSQGLPDARLRSRNDAGPAAVRRRFSRVPTPFAAQIGVDPDQLARFQTFWTVDTKGGVLPFWMPDPTADGFGLHGVEGFALLTETDKPLLIDAWRLVRFGEGAPAIAPHGPVRFRVSMTLEVMP